MRKLTVLLVLSLGWCVRFLVPIHERVVAACPASLRQNIIRTAAGRFLSDLKCIPINSAVSPNGRYVPS